MGLVLFLLCEEVAKTALPRCLEPYSFKLSYSLIGAKDLAILPVETQVGNFFYLIDQVKYLIYFPSGKIHFVTLLNHWIFI